MVNYQIKFRELKINANQIFRVFYVQEGKKSQVMDNFNRLPDDTKDEIKDLITKMATVKDFKSDKIRWRLKSTYSYGELKPKGHRLFFFLKLGNNIIFFKYSMKKKDSLGDSFYKRLELEKREYETEFEKSIS